MNNIANDKRLITKAYRLLPKIIGSQLFVLGVAYLISPEMLVKNLLTITNIYSGIAILALGGLVSFGLIAWDVIGMAGEY